MPRIVIFAGDGVGPEVVGEAVKVLGAVERRFGHRFQLESRAIGGDAIDRFGVPVRSEDIEATRRADGALARAHFSRLLLIFHSAGRLASHTWR